MKIVHAKPADAAISTLIESYFFISEMAPREVTTLPNGRVDATIILGGKIEWLYPNKGYQPLPAFCFYPLTREVNRAATRSSMSCVSIKFYPHLLTFPQFRGKRFEEPGSFSEFFESERLNTKLMKDLRGAAGQEEMIRLLDLYFRSVFFPTSAQSWFQSVTTFMENSGREQLRISEIADFLGITIKTLERRFIDFLGLTPKQYLKLVRLQQTLRNCKDGAPFVHGKMTSSLGAEYYDQAHFVKSCRNITGLSPKQLFVRLPAGMTDVVLQ